MDCSMPGFPVLHYLPEFAQTQICWVGDAIQPSHPPSSPSSLAFNLSQHKGLFNESALHIRWPKYWSFSFSISPSSEYSGLISFRVYWFDLLAVHGTLTSLLQQHSLKASVLLICEEMTLNLIFMWIVYTWFCCMFKILYIYLHWSFIFSQLHFQIRVLSELAQWFHDCLWFTYFYLFFCFVFNFNFMWNWKDGMKQKCTKFCRLPNFLTL